MNKLAVFGFGILTWSFVNFAFMMLFRKIGWVWLNSPFTVFTIGVVLAIVIMVVSFRR